MKKNTLKVDDQSAPHFVEALIGFMAGDGLGVRTKRDTELFLMHLLHKYTSLQKLSNKDASLLLRIPESRVSSLRYEMQLRHGEDDPQEYLRDAFLVCFYEAHFLVDSQRITFSVEDKYLRQLMEGALKSAGRFSDSSFNRELVKMPLETLAVLLKELWPEHYTQKKLSELDDELKKLKGDGPIKKVLKNTSIEIFKGVGKKLLTGGLL